MIQVNVVNQSAGRDGPAVVVLRARAPGDVGAAEGAAGEPTVVRVAPGSSCRVHVGGPAIRVAVGPDAAGGAAGADEGTALDLAGIEHPEIVVTGGAGAFTVHVREAGPVIL